MQRRYGQNFQKPKKSSSQLANRLWNSKSLHRLVRSPWQNAGRFAFGVFFCGNNRHQHVVRRLEQQRSRWNCCQTKPLRIELYIYGGAAWQGLGHHPHYPHQAAVHLVHGIMHHATEYKWHIAVPRHGFPTADPYGYRPMQSFLNSNQCFWNPDRCSEIL